MSEHIATLSRWINEYPPNAARDPEALLWHRCGKVAEEYGEVTEALIAFLNGNPRKGKTGTMDDVRHELLDVAVTALGAYNHTLGVDQSDEYLVRMLVEHLAWLCDRVGLGEVSR